MGNQQSKKNEAEVQPIKAVEVQLKHVAPKQDPFVIEIQNENQRNVNHRKSVFPVPDQVTTTTTTNPAPRLSKKQQSKKQLPPLKLKHANSMKSTPLGNCQNLTNQNINAPEELEELQCQKGHKTTGHNVEESAVGEFEERESEEQKQNKQAASNVRAKKFRPAQANSSKKTMFPSSAFVNEARQTAQLVEVTVL